MAIPEKKSFFDVEKIRNTNFLRQKSALTI